MLVRYEFPIYVELIKKEFQLHSVKQNKKKLDAVYGVLWSTRS